MKNRKKLKLDQKKYDWNENWTKISKLKIEQNGQNEQRWTDKKMEKWLKIGQNWTNK